MLRNLTALALIMATFTGCKPRAPGVCGNEPEELVAPADAAPPSAPAELTVGDRTRPLNVEGAPLFGWLPQHGAYQRQTAYQISVVEAGGGAVVWDSGKVESREQAYVPYGGPPLASQTSYAWSARTWDRYDRASPWAEPAHFDTGLRDADWGASWIRRESAEPDDYTLARKEVLVSSSRVTRARAYVACNHQCELYLNGTLVDRGSSFSYPGEGYYQATDITEHIAAGEPLAAGVIYHWYGPGQGRPAGERGLLVRLVIEHEDGSPQIVVSDETWRVARAAQWQAGSPQRNNDGGDYVERIDARRASSGWDLPGFDTSDPAWSAPQVIGRHPAGVFTHLVGREARTTATLVSPVSIVSLPDGAVVADFGKVMSARPSVHFKAGKSGRSLHLLAGYRLEGDGHVSTTKEHTQDTDLSFDYMQKDGAQDFRAFHHFAWRYLQISAPDEALGTDAIQAVVEHVEVPLHKAASFESSNATLNAVFELARHSALHSAAYQFVDTPTREKGQFLADARNISFASMAAYLERDMTRQALVEFANSQARYWPDGRLNAVYPNGDGKRDIPDFTEMYPGWVWHYYFATGDRAMLAKLYPVLTKIADYVWRYRDGATGLVTQLAGGGGPYQYGIVDWPAIGRYGYDMSTTARTTVNILAVDVMRNTAAAAAALGRAAGEREEYEKRAAELTTAINARLRRPDGIYVDGLREGNVQSPHASQHANSHALAYGVAPAGDHAALGKYIASLGMQQGPMTTHVLLQALSDADRVDDVVARLTDATNPGFGDILAKGATFTWESWSPSGNESESHGWGAAVLVDFMQTLLGVRVTWPGAATVAIVVPRTSLVAARGSVPTQRGPVKVDWRREASGALMVAVDVPANVSASVSLPVGSSSHSGRGEGHPALVSVKAGRAEYQTLSGHSEFLVYPPTP